MRLVCMSDSHNQHRRLPEPVPAGDVFIHAGDFGCTGKESDVRDFGDWLRKLPHPHKIVIAGNHDTSHQREPEAAREWLGGGFTYLEESGHHIDGLLFWGSPYHPQTDRWAFGFGRGSPEQVAAWAKIPPGVDVLITHGPPNGILDRGDSGHYGCEELRRVLDSGVVRPKVHIFGHVHERGGEAIAWPDGPRFFNVCVVAPGNRMSRGCTVIDLEKA